MRACFLLLFTLAAGAAEPLPDKGALPLQSLPAARFHFDGVVGARIDANIDAWLLRAPEANPGMLEMFRVRDRQPVPKLVPWAGEFAGKYLISSVQTLRLSERADLREHTARFVAELIATQAEDGYFGPFPQARRLLGEWDLWGHYHVMQGLLAWHDLTGDPVSFAAVRKAADLICRTYLDGPRRVFDAGSPEMNMAVSHVLAELHRRTGEARYLQLVREIEKDWERTGDYARTGAAGVPFFKTPLPRWESLHDLQTLAELWRITGEPRYRDAFTSHWRTIREFDVRNSGAFSGGEQATGNAFAPTAIETCCTVAWMALSIDMLRLTGDPRVADELELSTLNGALGAQHPSGRWWTYSTPMDGDRKASAHEIVFQARAGTPELNCCSVNGPRALGMLGEWAVMEDARGLTVNWLGPFAYSQFVSFGQTTQLSCATDYPLGNRIKWTVGRIVVSRLLTADELPETTLRFRIPAWSAKNVARLNGEPLLAPKAGTYLEVRRVWKADDVVELDLDFDLRTLAGQREQVGKVSLYRGPLLLAYDQRDNAFDEFAIPRVEVSQLAKASLVDVKATGGSAPWLLVEVPTVRGSLRLRDYATAGMTGTRYRSWLRTAAAAPAKSDGPPELRADLRGDAKPQAGSLVRATNFTPAENAVRLNGTDEMLVYALPPDFGAGDFTVAVRVRVNVLPEKRLGQIFSAWCAAGDDPLRLVVQDGVISARIEGGGDSSTGGVPVTPGKWQHLAAVKEADVLTLYVDGVPVSTASAPAKLATKSQACALGGNPLYSGPEFLAADFAAFSIHSRALSDEQIAALAK